MGLFKIVALYVPALIGWWFILVILVALAVNILCRMSPRFAVWYYNKFERKKKDNGNQ